MIKVIECKTCGETNLLPSDICGDRCVSCAGDPVAQKRAKRTLHDMTCIECGEEQKVLSNDMCHGCFQLWKDNLLEWQQNVI